MVRKINEMISKLFSTNKALETISKTINGDRTFRERHVLSRFLTIASNIVKNWIAERDSFSITQNHMLQNEQYL